MIYPSLHSIYWLSMVMLVVIFIILPLAIVFGAVGTDVCALYDGINSGSLSGAISKVMGSLGANCTTFTDAIGPLEQVLLMFS